MALFLAVIAGYFGPVERGVLGLDDEEVIVVMGKSPDSSRALTSSSLSEQLSRHMSHFLI